MCQDKDSSRRSERSCGRAQRHTNETCQRALVSPDFFFAYRQFHWIRFQSSFHFRVWDETDFPLSYDRYPLGGGKAAPKRQEITTDQSAKKKLDKKTEKSLKYTGDLCLRLGLEVSEEKTKKQVFAVTAAQAIKIEDMSGGCLICFECIFCTHP